jgi:hypothetical protein
MGFIGTTKVVPFQNRGFDSDFPQSEKFGRDMTFEYNFQNRGFDSVFPQPVQSCQ